MSFSAYLLILTLAGAAAAQKQPPPDLREAARLDQTGRCEESGKIYQRALAQATPGLAVWNNAGNHYLACGQPQKARAFFERVLRASPGHGNATRQLARLALEAGEFRRADELLNKLAAAEPSDFDVLFLGGRAAARAGNLTRAKERLEAALRLRPDDQEAMVECGLANAALGDFTRAVFLLARAHSRAPDRPAIALALARAAEDAGYHGDAVIAYDRYLALSPRDDTARRDRARSLALTAAGREQGERELELYRARNPADPLGHFYLAQIRWSQDADAALAQLAEAVRLDPRLAPAHVARAWLLHRLGRDPEALAHLESALRTAPRDVRALDQMGLVLLSLDRAPEAEAALRKAAALAPNDADVALHLGRALMDQGRDGEGQRWLDAYTKLRPPMRRDPRREPGMIELAALDPAARLARQIERFRAMARSRPDDPTLQLHLAGLLLSAGQRSEALREYQTLLASAASPPLWAAAGKALLEADEHAAARPFLERAGPGSQLDLAEALLRNADPAAALALLDGVPATGRPAAYLLLRARALDTAGRTRESARALAEALALGPPPATSAGAAALLLAKQGRYGQAIELLGAVLQQSPADRDLALAEALVLALRGDSAASAARLRRITARWPEWDRPWLVHGFLLLGAGRKAEAESKFRAAAALGAPAGAGMCANLREWVFDGCRK